MNVAQLNPQDVVVGAVAVAAGLVLAISAVTNAPWFFAMAKPRWLSETVGHGRARLVCAALGLAFVALGVVIALGYRPLWSSGASRSTVNNEGHARQQREPLPDAASHWRRQVQQGLAGSFHDWVANVSPLTPASTGCGRGA